MATYVQLGAVNTWYDEHGGGEPLVLLHGGFNQAGDAVPDAEWNVEQIAEFLGPAYGEVSPDGVDHFKVVATKVGEMAAVEPTLPASELAKVTCRSLEMFADDNLVTPST